MTDLSSNPRMRRKFNSWQTKSEYMDRCLRQDFTEYVVFYCWKDQSGTYLNDLPLSCWLKLPGNRVSYLRLRFEFSLRKIFEGVTTQQLLRDATVEAVAVAFRIANVAAATVFSSKNLKFMSDNKFSTLCEVSAINCIQFEWMIHSCWYCILTGSWKAIYVPFNRCSNTIQTNRI